MPLLDIVEGLLILRVVTIIVGVVLFDAQPSSTSVVPVLVWWWLEWSNILGWIFLCGVCTYRLIVMNSFKRKISHWCWVDHASDDNKNNENRSGGLSSSHLRDVLTAIRDCLVSNFYYPKRNDETSEFERAERYKQLNSSLSHSTLGSQMHPVFGSDTIRYEAESLSKATKIQHGFYGGNGGNGSRLKSQTPLIFSSAIELRAFTNGTQPTSTCSVIPPPKLSLDRGEDITMVKNTSIDSYDNNETTSGALHNRKDL